MVLGGARFYREGSRLARETMKSRKVCLCVHFVSSDYRGGGTNTVLPIKKIEDFSLAQRSNAKAIQEKREPQRNTKISRNERFSLANPDPSLCFSCFFAVMTFIKPLY